MFGLVAEIPVRIYSIESKSGELPSWVESGNLGLHQDEFRFKPENGT